MEPAFVFTFFLLFATIFAVTPDESKNKVDKVPSVAPGKSTGKPKPPVDPKNLTLVDLLPPKPILPKNRTNNKPGATKVIDRGFQRTPPIVRQANKTNVPANEISTAAPRKPTGKPKPTVNPRKPTPARPDRKEHQANKTDIKFENPPNNTKAIIDNFINEYHILLPPLLDIFSEIARLLEEYDNKTIKEPPNKSQKQQEELTKNLTKEIQKLAEMDKAAESLYVQEENFATKLTFWTIITNEMIRVKKQKLLKQFETIYNYQQESRVIYLEAQRLEFKLKLLEEDLKFNEDEIQALNINCPPSHIMIKLLLFIIAPQECQEKDFLQDQKAKAEYAFQKAQKLLKNLEKLEKDEQERSDVLRDQFAELNEKYEKVFSAIRLIRRQGKLARRLHKGINDQAEELAKLILGKQFSTQAVAKNVKKTVKALEPLIIGNAETPKVKEVWRKHLSAIIEKVDKKIK